MRVLLVDDHVLFLEGLHNLLMARGVEVVGTARDGLEALKKVRQLSPDIVLMDVRMPLCDGLTATRLIKAEYADSRIVILTSSDDENDLFEALRNGASGYLLKSLETETLVTYLEEVMKGEAAISATHVGLVLRAMARQHSAGLPPAASESEEHAELTARQLQILELVALGMSYKEVAHEIGLTERTIKYHMGDIVRAFHCRNREEVVLYAQRTGLIPRAGERLVRHLR